MRNGMRFVLFQIPALQEFEKYIKINTIYHVGIKQRNFGFLYKSLHMSTNCMVARVTIDFWYSQKSTKTFKFDFKLVLKWH